MNQSLNDIATQILNEIYAGLKAPANYSISLQQIKDEFSQERNKYITQLHNVNNLSPESYMQTIKKLPLIKKDYSGIANYDTNKSVLFANIPEILHLEGLKSIAYIVTMNKTFSFKIVYGSNILETKWDKYSDKAPTIHIIDNELWVFNPPVANMKDLSYRAILENPRAINLIPGHKFMDDDPYPMPGAAIADIRKNMVYTYVNQYRMKNPQPTLMAGDLNLNTGTK